MSSVYRNIALGADIYIYIYTHIYIYIHIFFLAVLCLRCCAWAFSSCGEQGQLFVVVHGLLIEVASLAAEHGL